MNWIADAPSDQSNSTTIGWTKQWIDQHLGGFWILWLIEFGRGWCTNLFLWCTGLWWIDIDDGVGLFAGTGRIRIILLALIPRCIRIPWVCLLCIASATIVGWWLLIWWLIWWLLAIIPCRVWIPAKCLCEERNEGRRMRSNKFVSFHMVKSLDANRSEYRLIDMYYCMVQITILVADIIKQLRIYMLKQIYYICIHSGRLRFLSESHTVAFLLKLGNRKLFMVNQKVTVHNKL